MEMGGAGAYVACLRGRKRFGDSVVLLWVMFFAGISVGFVGLVTRFRYKIFYWRSLSFPDSYVA
jgi:hypothetical protein